jgi:hypothetical protein
MRPFSDCSLFVVATLWLCCCTTQPPRPGANQPPPSDSADYSLTQRSASQQNRGTCTAANGCVDSAATAMVATPGQCNVELCEGDLSASAVAELRMTAGKAQDCYERELKEKHQLEGKMMVRLRLAKGREPCEIRVEKSDFAGSESFVKCVVERLRETRTQPNSGCIDLALPLSFVRQEVEALPDAGVPVTTPTNKP